ncbi:MAG: SoxR reducing system RseC family protein [Alkalispirochaeta sp.]
MNGFAVVTRVVTGERRADVIVYPASCGRCDENGGHCTREHRVIPAQIPEGVTVSPGDRVDLKSDPRGVIRAVLRLLVAPLLGGLAGLTLGGVRIAALVPRAAAQVRGDATVSLELPVSAVLLAILGVAIPIIVAVFRGASPPDRPRIVPISDGDPDPAFTAPGTSGLELQTVSIRAAGDTPR